MTGREEICLLFILPLLVPAMELGKRGAEHRVLYPKEMEALREVGDGFNLFGSFGQSFSERLCAIGCLYQVMRFRFDDGLLLGAIDQEGKHPGGFELGLSSLGFCPSLEEL